jgi:hypothetical protein
MMTPTKGEVGATLSSRTDADGASRSKARDAARGAVELPLHLTEKILCCINPLASARLATVCKSWAATISERLARPVPHLFVYLPADNKSDRRGRVVSVPIAYDGDDAGGAAPPVPAVIPNRVLLADTNGLACIGAMPSGHLAFASWWSKILVLINPITGARQSVQVEEPRRSLVLAAGGGDSFISVGTDEHILWRRAAGGDEWSRWTVPAAAAHRIVNIISAAVCSGCFYILDDNGHVSVIDVAAPPPVRMEKLPVASLFDGDHAVASPAVLNPATKGHLLESDGEVLFVRPVIAFKDELFGAGGGTPFCNHDAAVFLAVLGFEVYRLDLKDRRWAKVEKLPGDRAIFVSPGSSFVVRSSETAGCRSNCIYFVGNKWYCSLCNRDAGKAWGVYSMEDREVLFEHAVTEPGPCSAATWFLPRVV